MNKKLLSQIVKSVFAIALVLTLAFSQVDAAFAARSGGRIGGGSFRMPSRSYTSPTRSPGGGYYPRGGIGFPFLLPFFGFGGFGS
ncbi:MAG: hypothetical protein F6K24_39030, partial [Okeania sp. SIO2D1]|nr:hypothetical protein [Okeania sp. SIO2D1]